MPRQFSDCPRDDDRDRPLRKERKGKLGVTTPHRHSSHRARQTIRQRRGHLNRAVLVAAAVLDVQSIGPSIRS